LLLLDEVDQLDFSTPVSLQDMHHASLLRAYSSLVCLARQLLRFALARLLR
jgi:hypothetical protein